MARSAMEQEAGEEFCFLVAVDEQGVAGMTTVLRDRGGLGYDEVRLWADVVGEEGGQ